MPNVVQMPLVNVYAAGIDIGDTIHAVAIPQGLDNERVRTFGTMTCDLEAIAAWLIQTGITTVAMESTGVYWKPLFSLLNQKGLEVYLVNSRQIKNVTGRKTDEDDAMWIQKLHSCGLLKSAYLPGEQQEALRSLTRYRHSLVQDCSRFKNRIQKSLELMNIKFHTILADVLGKTGQAFIEAILAGERNPAAFLPLMACNIKADSEIILKSLEGNWRTEHIFTLRKSYEMVKVYQQHIAETDIAIEVQLQQYEASVNEGEITIVPTVNKPLKETRAEKKRKKSSKVPPYLISEIILKKYMAPMFWQYTGSTK
ncbi:MAG: IS110 family transposase [Bacteroidia bacterium]|nr:IS110 family transposase [Bacteroidia bacterium]